MKKNTSSEDRDNRSAQSADNQSPDNQTERVNLNDYYRKEESDALHEHSDENLKDVDRNLNEQMGGTDSTVTSEPNHI